MTTATEGLNAEGLTPAQLALALDPHQPLSRDNAALVAAHKATIARALRDLERGLRELSTAIAHAPFAVVFAPQHDDTGQVRDYRRLEHGAALAAAATAYATIELPPEASANEPLRCVGAVGVEDLTAFEIAQEVNRRKGVLKSAFAPIAEQSYVATLHVNGRRLNRKIPLARYILRQLEAASLNRLGAYRQIPMVAARADERRPPTPRRIGFTEQWVRSQPRMTLQALVDLAVRSGRLEDAEALRESGIPAREFLYRPKAPHLRMRANVAVHGADPPPKQPEYRRLMAELPLLFLRDRRHAWPQVSPPRPRREGKPRTHRPAALEPEPVLGSQGFFRRANPAERELAPAPR